MTRLPTIAVCQHRGKPHFRWYQNGRPRYRVIRDMQNLEMERIQLSARLLNGTSAKISEQQHKSLEDHIEEFYQDLLATASPKQAAQTRKRVEATIHEAGIKTLSDITVAKVRTAINRLRCAVRNPKKKPEDYPLLSERSRHHYARAMKQFTRWLEHEGRLDNPLRRWKLKKVVEERCPRDRLQPEELALLVRTAHASPRIIEGYSGQDRAWLYLLASMTGLRRGELAALEPASFDFTARSVAVAAAYTKAKVMAAMALTILDPLVLRSVDPLVHGG